MAWGLGLGLFFGSILLFFFLFLRLKAELTATLDASRREIGELSHRVQGKLEDNLRLGFDHFERVHAHLRQAESRLQEVSRVGRSIQDLNDLLKLPHLRGGFGEATLERLLADLLPAELYELQYRISPASGERVDAVIKYPDYVLPIDSKFPREQVLALFETDDPAAREEARRNLATVVKAAARSIREKYIRPSLGTAEMALLFVPSETLYFECLRNLRLGEELSRLKVFVVSPNTLAVMLHAVASARRYYEMAKGVETTIAEVRRAQQHFDHFERRFDEVGTALGKAQEAYQTAGTHLARYTAATTRLSGEDTASGSREHSFSPSA